MVEPLDIANFYRHAKDEETGFYVKKGTRPKRYRYIQSWLEHAERSHLDPTQNPVSGLR
ncbi:hypothetical protein CK203_037500 [Vitis vinifera]|uniref:EDS1 EP domain-containing protein n=1 Tax=Vitis vinifera TaxID=29760 RepID=A0A438HMH1_VITVI|nr:hypothetical protein CK203_037500 [Vitis vinifera]